MLILFSILLSSFTLFARDTINTKSIAPEYSGFIGTLLILENRDFVDNILNRITERKSDKNYNGDYEMIIKDDLVMKGCSDKKKFRVIVQLRNSRTAIRGKNGIVPTTQNL